MENINKLNNELEMLVSLRKSTKDNFYFTMENYLKKYNAKFKVKGTYMFSVSITDEEDILFNFENGEIEMSLLRYPYYYSYNDNAFKVLDLAVSLMKDDEFKHTVYNFYNVYKSIMINYYEIKNILKNF